MKHKLLITLQYLPWLALLLGMDAFAALLLWIADVQAFYSMTAAIILFTIVLFSSICCILICQDLKKEQAFSAFLVYPDEYHEELLLKTLSAVQHKEIRQLGSMLREKQDAYVRLQEQINDYEEYVESWAHETKTPLSLLTLLLDNRRDELSDTIGFKLDHIRNRIQESIDQMLFYARLKGTRKDYLFEPVCIRTCIEDVLEDYKPLLEEKQFQILYSLSDQTVYSDRRALRFLLGQLISNSIKYCGEEPELTVTFSQADGHDLLCIKDNGIGVRSCDLPYIFEKGFTGDSGEVRNKATGMGLYLAKEIAKELTIFLHAQSDWGTGFEMQISFPIVCNSSDYMLHNGLSDAE